jgi:hypothetical protein
VDFYNLDAILSVGYRVKSAVATRFRIWATRLLRESIVKGFLLQPMRRVPMREFEKYRIVQDRLF